MSFFDYFQLASLAFFVVLIAARIIYLRSRRGTNPVAIGRGKKGFQFIFEIYAFAALAGWMIEVISYALHIQLRVLPSILHLQVIDSPVAKIIGVLLITTGFVTLIFAFVSFGDSWRIGFDVRTPGQLVTTGVFGFSRKPIYVCLNLWFIGTFLINGTLIFLIFALLAIIHLHYQILREERFLLELYGQPYRDYLAKTGRYFSI